MSDVEEELVRLPQSLAGSQMSLPQSILTNQNSQTFVQTIKHTSSTPVHLNMNLQKEDGTLLEIRPTMTSPIKSPNPIPVTENNDNNNNNNRHNLQKEPTFLTQPDSEYGYSTFGCSKKSLGSKNRESHDDTSCICTQTTQKT